MTAHSNGRKVRFMIGPWASLRMATLPEPATRDQRGEGRLSQNPILPYGLTTQKIKISQASGCRRLPPADICLG